MLIHSIVSLSDIFYNEDNAPHAPTYRSIDGGLLELDGSHVRRLISTDPRLYLDSRYAPGQSLSERSSESDRDRTLHCSRTLYPQAFKKGLT